MSVISTWWRTEKSDLSRLYLLNHDFYGTLTEVQFCCIRKCLSSALSCSDTQVVHIYLSWATDGALYELSKKAISVQSLFLRHVDQETISLFSKMLKAEQWRIWCKSMNGVYIFTGVYNVATWRISVSKKDCNRTRNEIITVSNPVIQEHGRLVHYHAMAVN